MFLIKWEGAELLNNNNNTYHGFNLLYFKISEHLESEKHAEWMFSDCKGGLEIESQDEGEMGILTPSFFLKKK